MSKQPGLMVTGLLSSASGNVVIDLAKGTLTMTGPAVTSASAGTPDEQPFLVEKASPMAGQVFINAAALEVGKVDAAISVRTATLENGLNVMASLLSESSLSEQLAKEIDAISAGRSLADQVRQVLREELKPGGMLHRS